MVEYEGIFIMPVSIRLRMSECVQLLCLRRSLLNGGKRSIGVAIAVLPLWSYLVIKYMKPYFNTMIECSNVVILELLCLVSARRW